MGPNSLLWKIAGDPRGMLTGTAAGIMQLMYPGLGAGVTDHSNFFDDPFDRIFRSVPYIWQSIFVEDGDEATRAGKMIRDFHPDIKGTDHKGRKYHALDPDVFWWAHATFTWEFFRAPELYYAVPLSESDKDQLYAETVTWYRRYGISERPVPATRDGFEERFEEICLNELEMTPAASWVMDPGSNPATGGPPTRLPGALAPLEPLVAKAGADLLRITVYGNMPDALRRRFDFDWTNADRLAFAAICAAIRSAEPAIRFGALDALYPEGTPYLRAGSRDEVVVAGPNARQSARAAQAASN
ncbi:MAG: oxygenase MpaB family protein [Microthrixaceae bacterium]